MVLEGVASDSSDLTLHNIVELPQFLRILLKLPLGAFPPGVGSLLGSSLELRLWPVVRPLTRPPPGSPPTWLPEGHTPGRTPPLPYQEKRMEERKAC